MEDENAFFKEVEVYYENIDNEGLPNIYGCSILSELGMKIMVME